MLNVELVQLEDLVVISEELVCEDHLRTWFVDVLVVCWAPLSTVRCDLNLMLIEGSDQQVLPGCQHASDEVKLHTVTNKIL